MNGDELRFWVTVAVVIVGWAAAWGDLRRQVKSNRERADQRTDNHEKEDRERHQENVERLEDISVDVKRINGSVARHEEALDQFEKRLDRIQQAQPRRK